VVLLLEVSTEKIVQAADADGAPDEGRGRAHRQGTCLSPGELPGLGNGPKRPRAHKPDLAQVKHESGAAESDGACQGPAQGVVI
jgi:hypothetical protein